MDNVAARAITKDTAATGNTSRFADTAVFPPSIWTAAIRSETEAERERNKQTETEGEKEQEGAVRQRAMGMLGFNSRAR